MLAKPFVGGATNRDLTLKCGNTLQAPLYRRSSEGKTMPLSTDWLTRPLFVCPPRVARVLKVGILLALLLMIVSPSLVTLAWHLRHGNTIESRGKAIFVPPKWTAYIDESYGAELTKLPFVLSLNRGAWNPSMISVHPLPPMGRENNGVEYKTFESFFWNLHSDLGNAISGPFRTGSGPQEAFCMEAVSPGTTRTYVSCAILGGKWTADFMGDKKDLEDFYTIIRRLN